MGTKEEENSKKDSVTQTVKEEFCTYALGTALHGIGHMVAGHTSFVRRYVI